eukprot:INCI2301.1.p1 GENE.INCI2301.1~~INCI2301.1.p1  ORF type:complete len:169 (-),score=26.59 INCI2301.1:836-1342(-)
MLASMRTVARSVAFATRVAAGTRVRALGTAQPTVADVTVYVNFVDSDGNRSRVPGRIGQTLHEVAQMHKIDMDGHDTANNHYAFKRTDAWTEDVFGEGPSNAQDHVYLDSQWLAKVPAPMPEEQVVLEDHVYHDDLTPNSRLGSQIYLTKDINDIVVHLVDVPPSDIP